MQQNKLLNQRKIWTISKREENDSFEEPSERQNSQKKETNESSKMKEITQGCITHVQDFYHYLKKNGEMTECF